MTTLYTPPSGVYSSRFTVSSRRIAFGLSLLATGTSIGISMLAGVERGATAGERTVWVLVGVVTLLCAHLMPALSRGVALPVRLPAMLLWLVALMATGYTHATFFLDTQQHAGEVRAASMTPVGAAVAMPVVAGRDPSTIAAERARLKRSQVLLSAQKCEAAACVALNARRQTVAAQLDAIEVEFNEAQRREHQVDMLQTAQAHVANERDTLRQDPVTRRLAGASGVQIATLDLALALGLGWLLEGAACVGWLLALTPVTGRTAISHVTGNVSCGMEGPAASSVGSHVSSHVGSHEPGNDGSHGYARQVTRLRREEVTQVSSSWFVGNSVTVTGEVERAAGHPHVVTAPDLTELVVDNSVPGVHATDVLRLLQGVTHGEVRPTVAEIRRYFSCSQARAQSLRRAYLAQTAGN